LSMGGHIPHTGHTGLLRNGGLHCDPRREVDLRMEEGGLAMEITTSSSSAPVATTTSPAEPSTPLRPTQPAVPEGPAAPGYVPDFSPEHERLLPLDVVPGKAAYRSVL